MTASTPGFLSFHPSTALCLGAMKRLQPRREITNVLDLGCGGGILSVAAAELWPKAAVLAADISPQAVADAGQAFAMRGLEGRAKAIRSDGFSAPEIAARAPYDLILCNLLAGVLVKTAPGLKKHLKPGGLAIISGFMAWQAAEVEQAYASLNMQLIDKAENSPWVAGVVCHKTDI